MVENPNPSSAEVSDITNAVLEGADSISLACEVSNGFYTVESVKMLSMIIIEAERYSL
jgi:pyruvate kinase